MDVAKLSMALSQANVKQQASLQVMSKVMDQTESQSNGLIKMLDQASPAHPNLGTKIDIQA